ncbi:MAG: choice-of-anchor D domain-containing protein [Candidatus Acidiferrales bacterium]
MATRFLSVFSSLGVWRSSALRRSKASAVLLLPVALLCGNDSSAQTSQQTVYVSSPTSTTNSVVAGLAKNAQTGALSSIQGSPFLERLEGGQLAIDGQGRFLFVLNPSSNNISMFQIDQTTGALTEVHNSPFAEGPSSNPNVAPSYPTCVAGEKSGQYLYVGYRFGSVSPNGAVNLFQIDSANLRLIPNPASPSIDVASNPIGMFADPKGLHLYVGLGPNFTSGTQDNTTNVYSIDSVTGNLNSVGSAGGGTETGRSIAIDPQGRFFFNGWGSVQGFINSGLISPVDGTSNGTLSISLGMGNFPSAMLVDGSGKFLYVEQQGGVFVYSIDQTTGALTLLPGGPVALSFSRGMAVADPMGPYIYEVTGNALEGFQVDPVTGGLTSIATASSGGQAVTISGQPVQAVSGPVALLFPSSFDFGGATVGQPGVARIVHLVNSGNQPLSVNKIAMTGTDSGDFTATPAASCQPPTVLLPNANCPISLIFTPAAAGLRQALLTATDNAPGNPQSIPISGTGVPAASAVTLVPGTVSFPAITQGTTGMPENVSLTNSGSAKLNIFSTILDGANPKDFSMVNGCSGSLAVNASCLITVTFAPLAAGGRAATVTITDDAPGSPQVLALSGNAARAFTVTPSASGSTSATVAAGQTAQFNLQLSPGTGFSGDVSLVCAGAPMAATCTAPSVLHVINGSPMPFSVAVMTSGSGAVTPVSPWPRIETFANWRSLPLFVMWLLLLVACARRTLRENFGPARRRALGGLLTTVVLLAAYGSAGCGGGSSVSSALVQTPTVTPTGTSTLTLAMTVSTAGGKQLTPPPPIQLTLTVK